MNTYEIKATRVITAMITVVADNEDDACEQAAKQSSAMSNDQFRRPIHPDELDVYSEYLYDAASDIEFTK